MRGQKGIQTSGADVLEVFIGQGCGIRRTEEDMDEGMGADWKLALCSHDSKTGNFKMMNGIRRQ